MTEPDPEGLEAGGAPRLAAVAAPVLRAFDRRRLALLRRAVPPPARLLDAGAGRGRFVAAARAAGYDATGLEPSRRGVEGARAAYGVALEHAPLTASGPAVDAVTLWHVLEHVDDPAGALRAVHARLVPGGTLLVGVPNLGSLQARLGGERWYHLDLARHRTHFTVPGLLALLGRTGFAPGRPRFGFLEHDLFGAWQTLANRATGTDNAVFAHLRREPGVPRGAVAASVALLPAAPLVALAERAAGAARRGATVAVLATRAGSAAPAARTAAGG